MLWLIQDWIFVSKQSNQDFKLAILKFSTFSCSVALLIAIVNSTTLMYANKKSVLKYGKNPKKEIFQLFHESEIVIPWFNWDIDQHYTQQVNFVSINKRQVVGKRLQENFTHCRPQDCDQVVNYRRAMSKWKKWKTTSSWGQGWFLL